MASITQQIKALRSGQSFTTTATRNGIYVAAKRVGIEIQTTKINDAETRVKLAHVEVILSPVESVARYLRDLSVSDRLQVFEQFELCCGYNRGSCVCPEPVPEIAEVGSRPSFGNATAGMNPAMARFMTAMEAQAEPVADDWRFTKESPQYDDNGNVYRKQFLYGTKRTRNVEVDPDDLDRIK